MTDSSEQVAGWTLSNGCYFHNLPFNRLHLGIYEGPLTAAISIGRCNT